MNDDRLLDFATPRQAEYIRAYWQAGTYAAAVKLGRQFVGIEMAEHHFRDAEARIMAANSIHQAANDNAPTPAECAA